jgi:PAS domain S-box-containing protein
MRAATHERTGLRSTVHSTGEVAQSLFTTEGLQAQPDLRQARLALAERIPDWGSWTWDLATDGLIASGRFTSLLGVAPGSQLRMADALSVMPAEDRAGVESSIEQVRSGTIADSFGIEYRVRAADGTTRWLKAYCDTVRGSDGAIVKVLGVTIDVTERITAAAQLEQASEFWQATLESLTADVAVLDERGQIVAVNRSWPLFAGRKGEDGDFIGSSYLAICRGAGEPLAERIADGLAAILAGQRARGEWEYPSHTAEERRWFVLRATRFEGSGPVRVVLALENVTDRHLAEEEVAIQAALLGEIDAAVIIADLDGRLLEWSEGAQRLHGWTREEALGQHVLEMMEAVALGDSILAELLEHGSWQGELEVRRKDGSVFPGYHRARLLRDDEGRPRALAGITVDISESQRAARELASARDYMRAVADSMGQALYTLDHEGRAQYLNPVCEEALGWTTAELRGKLLHPIIHYRRPDGSDHPANECPIVDARLGGQVVRVEDDVFIRRDGSDLPVAYTAAPFTTADGPGGCVVVFEDISERKAEAERVALDLEKLDWIKRVRDALRDDRFVLYSQPIVDLRTGGVTQQELLIRMLDPESSGVIAPGAFLPAAEELGLIGEIDRWVIDQATQIAAAGQAVELNVSARSITDPGLIEHVKRAIERTEADPEMLVFEITETAIASDQGAALMFVEQLHALGCRIALDDFGTGFGTFTYLKQLPIDYLKIDIEFVRDLPDNLRSRGVVETVVGLARRFGLQTVAEGVEDAESMELLRELGVDFAQGYHIARPAPLELGP